MHVDVLDEIAYDVVFRDFARHYVLEDFDCNQGEDE